MADTTRLREFCCYAVNGKFKPSHYAGMGHSRSFDTLHLTSPSTGWLIISEYNGIGD
jgi:hypothetical protein